MERPALSPSSMQPRRRADTSHLQITLDRPPPVVQGTTPYRAQPTGGTRTLRDGSHAQGRGQ
eukprot:12921062-Prorocentrum_lima.AAC.1